MSYYFDLVEYDVEYTLKKRQTKTPPTWKVFLWMNSLLLLSFGYSLLIFAYLLSSARVRTPTRPVGEIPFEVWYAFTALRVI